jgi:elongation factor P--(R)-beta-lysine ligase
VSHEQPKPADVPSWAPSSLIPHSSSLLKRRAELLAAARRFLDSRGYLEVETPLLSFDVGVDLHLEPFQVSVGGFGGEGEPRTAYLQTSPEFGMKRLLAAGLGDCFQITRSFRRGEVGALHNPEFTIIEWYRVGGSYRDLMTEVGEFASSVCGWPMAKELSYAEAFERHLGISPHSSLTEDLQRLAAERNYHSTDRDELLNFLLADAVEPNLGVNKPTLLFDYPSTQAALAKIRNDDAGAVAERFELYFNGVELANGYQELTDADELRRRNRRQNELRISKGLQPLPLESKLLAAMDAGLPECTGVALGFDRLIMLALGCSSVAEVMAFPFDRA